MAAEERVSVESASNEEPPRRRGSVVSMIVIGLCVVLGLAGIAVLGVMDARTAGMVAEGDPAPAFVMDRLGGGRVTSDELRGQVVMLDFWATWCPPCVEELPSLVKLAKEYESRGLVFVAANRDDPPDAKVTAALFVDRRIPDLKPYVAFASDQLAMKYGVQALPTLYFIDRDGKIIESHRGALTEKQLRNRIEMLFEKEADPR